MTRACVDLSFSAMLCFGSWDFCLRCESSKCSYLTDLDTWRHPMSYAYLQGFMVLCLGIIIIMTVAGKVVKRRSISNGMKAQDHTTLLHLTTEFHKYQNEMR